jgi:hypothetical protein
MMLYILHHRRLQYSIVICLSWRVGRFCVVRHSFALKGDKNEAWLAASWREKSVKVKLLLINTLARPPFPFYVDETSSAGTGAIEHFDTPLEYTILYVVEL